MANHDLFTSITQLLENREDEYRKLEEYLLACWFLANQYKYQSAISANQFIELLRLAFVIEIPVFRDEWRDEIFDQYSDEVNSYLAFEEKILEQIVDLREMDETGLLSNELRFFGLDSPRGNRWYNFDPLTYIECAIAGFNNDAEEKLEKDQDAHEYFIRNQQISWTRINDFFYCGRIYE